MVGAICQEISDRKDYLNVETISSVYFGGGTPSLLNQNDLNKIWQALKNHFAIEQNAEITLEANPDDLTNDTLNALSESPINRLSIGVQSFFEVDLRYMNRAHSAIEAMHSVQLAKEKGFDNITIDLIYGTPTLSEANWESNLQRVIDLAIPHLSAYQLTVENGTPLQALIARGKKTAPPEESAVAQFNLLTKWAKSAGFEHYEISNLALPGHQAVHNSSYWSGEPYIGIGPSAHSFDGRSRQWNIAHNPNYIKSITNHKSPIAEIEILKAHDLFNEYIMTGLRLTRGVDEYVIQKNWPSYADHFKLSIAPHISSGYVHFINHIYSLTRDGKIFADRIASDCFAIYDTRH
jgi:oxygen-independent coproporphyrinogen-3 oxidase